MQAAFPTCGDTAQGSQEENQSELLEDSGARVQPVRSGGRQFQPDFVWEWEAASGSMCCWAGPPGRGGQEEQVQKPWGRIWFLFED